MSTAWWDWFLTWWTGHCPSLLRHCQLGHTTHKIISEMTLNPTIPYHTILALTQKIWRVSLPCILLSTTYLLTAHKVWPLFQRGCLSLPPACQFCQILWALVNMVMKMLHCWDVCVMMWVTHVSETSGSGYSKSLNWNVMCESQLWEISLFTGKIQSVMYHVIGWRCGLVVTRWLRST